MKWSALIRYSVGKFVTVLVACIVSAIVTFAQTGTTSVHGTVTDKTGAVITAAKVTILNPELGLERTMDTGTTGEFEFLALQPGTYSLQVEASGFRKYERKGLELLVNSPGTANVTLEVGSSAQTVEVSAQTETLNTTDASLGIAFDENQVKQLPMEGRNVPELLSLQAGVAYTGNRPDINKDIDTRSGAVNGARSDQSNITLDGVDVNSDTKGYAFTSVLPITADSVQEFRVTTSNYNADEGRSSGAQVALVTKGGTNDFHGSLYEYHRNTLTSANDYFVKLSELQSGRPNEAPKLIRNIFGGSLGGPIIKQRLFFFVNYEAARQREAQSVVRVVPSDALRDGVMTYLCQTLPDGSLDTTTCPGGTVQGLTATHNIKPGYFGLTPGQIQGMDPQGIGISTGVMIPYFNSFPHANDSSVGDGYNFQAYRFSGPVQINDNWYIARMDYKITTNGNHSLFWRGALRDDSNPGVPYLPGGAPEVTRVDYSKGFSVGYSAILKQNLVNNFRWGFTRQSVGQTGNQTADYVQFRNLNDGAGSQPNNAALAVTNTTNYQVPVHNFVDDVSWIKGKHTLQFGGNINILRNPQSSNINSFSSAVTNASWFDTAALANTGAAGHFDPAFEGFPAVDSGFGNNYDYPMIALVGMISQVNAQYNFDKQGNVLSEGTPLKRRFAADAYEMYAQDVWKIKPNLTVTYGLRYSLFSPPWETNGLQVSPNVNLSDWFSERAANAANGLGSSASPNISFHFSGPANGRGGFYNWDTKDLGPHLAIAYSPGATDGLLKSVFGGPGKTSIRAGFGMVYDRVGPALLATFDESGSFGLSEALTNIGGTETPAIAPRIQALTGPNSIPKTDLAGNPIFSPQPTSTLYPTSGVGSFAVYWGMDQGLKTPYSYTIDFSVGRELGRGFTLDVAYVGRLSHRLLSQEDVAAPVDLKDPKSGLDYFTAVQTLAKVYRGNNAPLSQNITDSMFGAAAQYFADIYPTLSPGQMFNIHRCTGGTSLGSTDPVMAAYDLFCGFSKNETTALQGIDQGFGITDTNGNSLYALNTPYTFLTPQFAALYSWRSISKAAYNGLQVSLRHRMSHGLQFDFNYTYSKSLDVSSDANRITAEGGLAGQIINPWAPNSTRGVSDFDTPHQFNTNWIWELPFGRGRWLGKDSNRAVDAVIGGWQLTGLARWTSGFPFSIGNGAQWPTNWQLSGFATQIAPVTTHGAVKNPDGTVSVFGNAAAAATALGAFTADMPGQVGARNTFRGDGFAGLDLGLDKRWKITEHTGLQFRWEVFNALNLTRFDVNTLTTGITNGSTFGTYSGLLTNPRTMQFALRFEF